MQNLISNSLKFHGKDKPPIVLITGKLVCGTRLADFSSTVEVCEITVRDNGIGFDEAYADQVFEAFHRLHPREEYEGSGMGLAICRKIVERHGGHIRARSAPGQGATFIVTLPLQQLGGG